VTEHSPPLAAREWVRDGRDRAAEPRQLFATLVSTRVFPVTTVALLVAECCQWLEVNRGTDALEAMTLRCWQLALPIAWLIPADAPPSRRVPERRERTPRGPNDRA
jgi:hypothetical protein